MKILARRIKRELEKRTERNGHCAIYEDELQRIWPLNGENRKAKIEQFAKEYGFKLSFYKQGLCAIFEKEGGTSVAMKHWEAIADNLSKAGWSWDCVSTVDSQGRVI
jgi:hypothetical protein